MKLDLYNSEVLEIQDLLDMTQTGTAKSRQAAAVELAVVMGRITRSHRVWDHTVSEERERVVRKALKV